MINLREEIKKNAVEKAKGYDIEKNVENIEQCYRKVEFGIDKNRKKRF